MSDQNQTGNRAGNTTWQNTTWRSDGGSRSEAFDPWAQPELFSNVLTKRLLAFLIDLVVLSIPIVLAIMFITIFGVVTLGLGWMLFWLVSPFSVIWAVAYYGFSLGGSRAATVGMRMLGIEMRTWSGQKPYFLLGAMHAVLYWVSVSFLTPAVVLVGLFNGRRRLLHDIVLGTVVVNAAVRPNLTPAAR